VTLDHGTPKVAVKIQGAERILIVDSGSSCSVFQPGIAEVPLESMTFETLGVMGDSLDIVGWVVTVIHFWFANCHHLPMALLDGIF